MRSAAVLMLAMVGWASADDKSITVPGTKTEFPAVVDDNVGEKPVHLRLTGVGLRQKLLFNVYSMASYIPADAKYKTAEEVATADVAKRLHLILERDVSSADMASALRAGIESNHPKEFDSELKSLDEYIKSLSLKKGTSVVMTHVPGTGLSVMIGEKTGLEIRNLKFSLAVWEIYLGKKNLGEKLKRSLVGKL